MALEEFSLVLSTLRRKLYYIAIVFGAGSIISFNFMGALIKKIENDMFFRLNIPNKPDTAAQLSNISRDISLMAKELAVNNSAIAQNLSNISKELLNVSQSLQIYKPTIVYLTPMEVLMLEFKMSLIFGFLAALPLISYYAYKGLRGRVARIMPVNKSMFVFAIIAAIILFLLGAGYAYFYMLPFFLSYIYQDALSIGVNATFSVYEFIYFITMTTIILGAAFELPLVMFMLVRFGVVTRNTLAHYRKHAYILLLIAAAWVTPDPTMFSQMMVMLPFVVLYEVSLLAMRLSGR